MKQLLTTFFGIGLAPVAPGTVGSAIALLMGIGIFELLGTLMLLLVTAIISIIGFWSTSGIDPASDPAEIVIDEAAGQLVSILPIPLYLHTQTIMADYSWVMWLAAFTLFRLFDIWKPGIIGNVDRSHSTGSIMMDDLLAGVFAAISLTILLGVTALLLSQFSTGVAQVSDSLRRFA